MRWKTPDGVVWDSRFEAEVFDGYGRAGYQVRQTTEHDRVLYTRGVRNGLCGKCGSAEVATSHSYQADLSILPKDGGQQPSLDDGGAYLLEVKGYIRAERRSLLRALLKARPDLRLRLLVQRDYKVTKSLSLTDWAVKYLRIPVAVWTGQPPTTWRVKE
jgi:hypothetical protein